MDGGVPKDVSIAHRDERDVSACQFVRAKPFSRYDEMCLPLTRHHPSPRCGAIVTEPTGERI